MKVLLSEEEKLLKNLPLSLLLIPSNFGILPFCYWDGNDKNGVNGNGNGNGGSCGVSGSGKSQDEWWENRGMCVLLVVECFLWESFLFLLPCQRESEWKCNRLY